MKLLNRLRGWFASGRIKPMPMDEACKPRLYLPEGYWRRIESTITVKATMIGKDLRLTQNEPPPEIPPESER